MSVWLDLVVVPSDFCQGVAVGAGIPAEKIEVVSWGHDPRVFRPADARADRPFTLLHVAGPHTRKATSGVVQAFVEAFRGVEDVRLTIKTTVRGAARRGFVPSPRPHDGGAPAREIVALFAAGDARVVSLLLECHAGIG